MLTDRRRLILVIAVIVCLAQSLASNWAGAAGHGESFRVSILTIETNEGPRRIEVEIAETAAQRETGLQYRRHMAPDRGMLFDFGRTGPVAMWMKNTVLSLDMLFVEANGRIIHIKRATEPLSLKIIGAPKPVKAVLEVLAGTADRLKIRVGDRLRHPLFD